MSDLPDLLPCPFCGGEASAEGMQIYSRPLSDTWWEDGSEITEAFFCNCIRCGISNVVGSVGHRTRDMAIAAWNRRAEAGQLCNSTVEETPVVTPRAWTNVMGERKRQMAVEGWTPEHDDAYDDGELAAAAATYALSAANCIVEQPFQRTWPWQNAWWKPTVPRRDLVKAGALILAEIERLDRAALAKGGAA